MGSGPRWLPFQTVRLAGMDMQESNALKRRSPCSVSCESVVYSCCHTDDFWRLSSRQSREPPPASNPPLRHHFIAAKAHLAHLWHRSLRCQCQIGPSLSSRYQSVHSAVTIAFFCLYATCKTFSASVYIYSVYRGTGLSRAKYACHSPAPISHADLG